MARSRESSWNINRKRSRGKKQVKTYGKQVNNKTKQNTETGTDTQAQRETGKLAGTAGMKWQPEEEE
jgi:hypothetical protein